LSERSPEILTAPYYERLDELERRHWWCRSVRRVALGIAAADFSGGATVLDAGCGAGGFLAQLSAGWPSARCVGADISADALRFARGRRIRELIFASAVELPIASGRVDVLFSNDVLQHLPEGADALSLREARRVLKPGGLLCVRSNIGRGAVPGAGLHRRYSRRDLARLVSGAGFRIERHLVLHALPSLFKRRPRGAGSHGTTGGDGGLATTVPPALLNSLLDLYTRIEDRLARLLPFPFPFGDAQIVLARRGP
jgi:ubiquinone/menaquinone biosynthesis C-methylase UbiE